MHMRLIISIPFSRITREGLHQSDDLGRLREAVRKRMEALEGRYAMPGATITPIGSPYWKDHLVDFLMCVRTEAELLALYDFFHPRYIGHADLFVEQEQNIREGNYDFGFSLTIREYRMERERVTSQRKASTGDTAAPEPKPAPRRLRFRPSTTD